MIVLIGSKIGMTKIFNKNGVFFPVTVIEIKKNIITLITKHNGKYITQLTTGSLNIKKVNKPKLGFFNKINVRPGFGLWEVPYIKKLHLHVGQFLSVDIFKNIKKVDVIGITKGKGFAGTIKRWNFSSQDSTHGNSLSHRVPGSIGQNQTPGKVFKGKKMCGHLGNNRNTVQNLNIVKIYSKKNILLIRGSVPGYNGSRLIVRSSIKQN